MDQATTGAPPALHVSTDMFGARERFDEWRETFALKIVRADLIVPDKTTFQAATRAQALERMAVVASSFSPVQFLRTKELVRDDNDDVHLVIPTLGRLKIRFGDRAFDIEPGGAALVPAHLVGGMQTDTQAASLTIGMPRALLSDLAGNAGLVGLRPIAADIPALRLLRLYLQGIMSDTAPLDAASAVIADRQIRELIAHLFDPSAELARAAPAGGLKAARLRAVMSGIEEHLTNPALSAAWLGARLGLSDRYVQHLLAQSGLGFADLVRRKRAERARQMLEGRVATPLRIVDVAFAVGFGDLSSFNRAFRERFGCTPSDVLHRRTLN
jgi:AraC-like DNA-binding protein